MEMTLLVLQKPINHELITRTLKSLSNPCKPQRLIVSCQTNARKLHKATSVLSKGTRTNLKKRLPLAKTGSTKI